MCSLTRNQIQIPHVVIKVSARPSPLSQVQLKEVLEELQQHHPHISFEALLVPSTGDKDKVTSLRTLERTDFFTKEIDEHVLNGACRIAIHSAKDLPEPLTEGLKIVALTKGIDSADVLVLRQGEILENLRPGAVIATSAERREESVRQLCPGHVFQFVDLRGTIGERLARLDKGGADGVVIAEAAIIRLGLTHLTRFRLPGTTTPLQGRLAVVAREDDAEMEQLFSPIDYAD